MLDDVTDYRVQITTLSILSVKQGMNFHGMGLEDE